MSRLLREGRAWVGRLPGVRSLLARPAVADLLATLSVATLVRGSVGFAVRQLRGTRMVRRYRLRRAPVDVVLEHATPDVFTLAEIFFERIYEPPPEVAAVLGSGPERVLDLGANVGLYAAWAGSRWPGAGIRCVEPDPRNLALLRRNAADAVIEPVAAGAADGTVSFAAGAFAASRVGPGDLEVPARDCLPWLAESDLAKIDIEGSEWDLLADPRLAASGPPALAVEYHAWRCPHPPARDCAERLLGAAGYATRLVFHDADQDIGMLWAWRSPGR